MGQRQLITNLSTTQSYPQRKPQEIVRLEKYIDEGKYTKVYSSELHSHNQLLLSSQKSQKYVFEVKCDINQLAQDRPIQLDHINGPVQIFLRHLDNNKNEGCLIFQGELFKGKRRNFGIQYNLKGQAFYQGYFQSNKYYGWGVTSNYEGEWVDGMKCGYGKYKSTYQRGERPNFTYEGSWKNDRFDGIGARNVTLTESNEFLKQDFESKQSGIDYQYIGQWLQGARFGCGKMIKYQQKGIPIQRQVYEGQFAHNTYHGRGKIKIGESNFEHGKFQSGKIVKDR